MLEFKRRAYPITLYGNPYKPSEIMLMLEFKRRGPLRADR